MKTDKQMIDELYNDVQKYDERKKNRSKIRISVILAVAVMMALAVFVNAEKIRNAILSPEWFEEYKTAVETNTDGKALVAPFKEKMAESSDPFVKQSLENDSGSYFYIDGKEEIEIDETVSSEGIDFRFVRITSGEKLYSKYLGGSIADCTNKHRWTVDDAFFAIFEISRSDGKPLDDETMEHYPAFCAYIEGYDPRICVLLTDGAARVEYWNDHTMYYAIEVTEAVAFAGEKTELVLIDSYVPDILNILETDESGNVTFADRTDGYPRAMFELDLDGKYKNEEIMREFDKSFRMACGDEELISEFDEANSKANG